MDVCNVSNVDRVKVLWRARVRVSSAQDQRGSN
jgi:hypothetical protein